MVFLIPLGVIRDGISLYSDAEIPGRPQKKPRLTPPIDDPINQERDRPAHLPECADPKVLPKNVLSDLDRSLLHCFGLQRQLKPRPLRQLLGLLLVPPFLRLGVRYTTLLSASAQESS